MYSVYLIDYNATPESRGTPTPTREKLYIYDQITHDEGMMLTEPVLSIGASRAGSFSFTLPKTNYGFNKIIKGVTRVVVEQNEKVIFMGRVRADEEDFYLNKKIEAEGALRYLNDSLTEKKIFTYKTLEELLNYIFDNHNNKFQGEPWKQFHLELCEAQFVGRDDTSTSSNKISYYSMNFDKTLDVLQELVSLADGAFKIVYNALAGYWEVHVYNKNKFPVNDNQPIEFGLNLLDLVQTNDTSGICTAVAPFGGDLIQESKEIGEAIAGYVGNNPDSIYNHILIRGPKDYDYMVWDVSKDPEFKDSGYWAFEFDISAYNAAHPDKPLKKLYVSWRACRFVTGPGYIADNAWRVVSRIDGTDQSLGYHGLKDGEGFEGEINEVIDLTDAKYSRATHILMGGWGGLITPLIKREAIVVEENDKLNISKCEAFNNTETDGLEHQEGSFYLRSNKLINSYGLIEKKLEYDIDDSNIPKNPFEHPYHGPLGNTAIYSGYALGYDVGDGSDFNTFKGDYQIIPFVDVYTCIEYSLPDFDDTNYPRGIYITSRMHHFGTHPWNGKNWLINGMYVLLDTSHQVLTYKAASEPDNGVGFTNLKREYIDLSSAECYGAKYIRVGGYIGDGYGIELIPSDDTYARDCLMQQAKLYLTEYQWEKVVIEATAVDLSMTDDQWQSLEICTNVPVISSIYDPGMYFPITSLDIQLDAIDNNKVILGFDNEEYITNQLAENSRLASIAATIEERRKK